MDTPEALDELVTRLRRAGRIALDTETTSLDAMRARLVGISLADAPGTGDYLPVGHDERLHPGRQLPLESVREKLGPLLADPGIAKVGHNAKFDLIVLEQHGLPVEGLAFDTMIAAWLLDPSGRGFGLKNQAWQRLGVEMTAIEELDRQGPQSDHHGPGERGQGRTLRCCRRRHDPAPGGAFCTPSSSSAISGRSSTEIEMPLVQVLMDMEMHGMVVDADYLREMSREMAGRSGGPGAARSRHGRASLQHQLDQATRHCAL